MRKHDMTADDLLAILLEDGIIRWKNFGVLRLRKRKAMEKVIRGVRISIPARIKVEFVESKSLKKILCNKIK